MESEGAPADWKPTRSVLLEIPADRDHVALVRSVAVHVAAGLGLGFGVTDVTDLRLAVDEACNLFLVQPEVAGALRCLFETGGAWLRVTVSAPAPGGFTPDVEDIGWIMLGALVDELDWSAAGGRGTVTLAKRLPVRES